MWNRLNFKSLFSARIDYVLLCIVGYNVDTATNDVIRSQFGQNACAGCVAVGADVGIGMVGEPVNDTTTEAEVNF